MFVHNTRPKNLLGVDCTVYFLVCETTILPTLPPIHDYFLEMLQVNLGVMMKDENKLEELLEVLEYYHSYVPKTSDNELDPKLCFGKEMSLSSPLLKVQNTATICTGAVW